MLKCRVIEILDGPPVLSSPLVNSTVYQIKQIGAFYPLAHRDPKKMAQLTESIHTLFGFQGIRVPFDPCGDTRALLDLIRQTRFSGFSFEGSGLAVNTAGQALGSCMALIGNIPTSESLLHGTPSKVKQDARRALAEGVHLLAPACAVPPQTPPENLQALRQAVEDYMQIYTTALN